MTDAMTTMVEAVFNEYALPANMEEIRSASRQRQLVMYRKLVAKILRDNGYTLSQIGGFLNRDHATVLHILTKCPWHEEFKMFHGVSFKDIKRSLEGQLKYHERMVEEIKNRLSHYQIAS